MDSKRAVLVVFGSLLALQWTNGSPVTLYGVDSNGKRAVCCSIVFIFFFLVYFVCCKMFGSSPSNDQRLMRKINKLSNINCSLSYLVSSQRRYGILAAKIVRWYIRFQLFVYIYDYFFFHKCHGRDVIVSDKKKRVYFRSTVICIFDNTFMPASTSLMYDCLQCFSIPWVRNPNR